MNAPTRGSLSVVPVREDLADRVEALELLCFPHANPAQLITAGDARASARVFPEGFFVVLDGDRVVAQAAGIFVDFDFDDPHHSVIDVTGEHQCGNHRAEGRWYYGTDLAVHPDYRGKGLGRWLYDLRKDLVRRHGKAGIVAGAHLPGFANWKQRITADEYIRRVVAGELTDPTLSFQLSQGFRAICALEGYLEDPSIDSWAALIAWENTGWETGTGR